MPMPVLIWLILVIATFYISNVLAHVVARLGSQVDLLPKKTKAKMQTDAVHVKQTYDSYDPKKVSTVYKFLQK